MVSLEQGFPTTSHLTPLWSCARSITLCSQISDTFLLPFQNGDNEHFYVFYYIYSSTQQSQPHRASASSSATVRVRRPPQLTVNPALPPELLPPTPFIHFNRNDTLLPPPPSPQCPYLILQLLHPLPQQRVLPLCVPQALLDVLVGGHQGKVGRHRLVAGAHRHGALAGQAVRRLVLEDADVIVYRQGLHACTGPSGSREQGWGGNRSKRKG